MRESADYFDFAFDTTVARAALDGAVEDSTDPLRIRLLLGRDGRVRVERSGLVSAGSTVNVCVATTPVDPKNVRLYHKTTHRDVYDRARAQAPDHDDVILWNPLGQVTESTNANVVVELDGTLVTPPVACGLLGGTFRAEMLERGEIEERVITLDDLARASRIWLINSVYEWRPAIVTFRR
jgi:para-aminobenzoate synthetase/4-amino-4-deoxychorismate lyase